MLYTHTYTCIPHPYICCINILHRVKAMCPSHGGHHRIDGAYMLPQVQLHAPGNIILSYRNSRVDIGCIEAPSTGQTSQAHIEDFFQLWHIISNNIQVKGTGPTQHEEKHTQTSEAHYLANRSVSFNRSVLELGNLV